jgi:hypothetical protein
MHNKGKKNVRGPANSRDGARVAVALLIFSKSNSIAPKCSSSFVRQSGRPFASPAQRRAGKYCNN